MPLYMVERVMPGLTADALAEAQRCLHEAVHRVSDSGDAVRFLRCTFIPDQQRCLDLFDAGSAAQVRRVNDIAQVPFRWIGEALEDVVQAQRPGRSADHST